MKEYFIVPSHCNLCKELLQNDGVFLTCVNEACDVNKIGNLKKWIKSLDLKGIADATIETLYDNELIETPADFYKLTEESFIGLEGFGNKKIQNFLDTIHSKKELSFGELIGGLNIPNVSQKTGDLLFNNGYKSIELIIDCPLEKLTNIDGLGDISSNAIKNGVKDKLPIIKELFDVGIKIKEEEKIVIQESNITNKKFVFTGEISISRNEAQNLVKRLGGICPSGISKGVDFLVCADPDSNTTKLQKASKYGIKIIGGEEFLKMVNFENSEEPIVADITDNAIMKNYLEFE